MVRTLVAITLIVGAGALGVAASAVDGSSNRTARLHLQASVPLQLRGTSFAAGERVRVRVSSRSTSTKRVTASRSGSFVVRFGNLTYDRCNGLLAEASGSEGSVARLKRPQPLCPPN